jgi:cysteine desulfurase
MHHDIIYLDNNASTAPDPAVVDALTKCLRRDIGNPASHHVLGARAANRVEHARAQVAALTSCHPREVVFTSGATEADNLAVRGLWEATRNQGSRDTVLIGATEHPAVLEAGNALRRYGARVVHIPVDSHGVVDLSALRSLADERTLLISVMAANNETGTVAPLAEVMSIGRTVGAFIHSDATQFVGRLSFDFAGLALDMASLSAHKMHGPKGVGALLVRRGVPLLPLLHGGGHERALRSGTLNTPGIVGFGAAAELALARLHEAARISQLRDRLHTALCSRLEGVSLNGHLADRLPNTVNLRFAGADAEAVMASMPQVACSTGSACSSAVPTPSHVLLAMGLDRQAADECLRFSLSRQTTEAEIDAAVEQVVSAVSYVRAAAEGAWV